MASDNQKKEHTMSSINTSNSVGYPLLNPRGKIATDPNTNPLQPGHQNELPNGSDPITKPEKTPSNPADLIRAATTPESITRDANPTINPTPREISALDTAQKLVSTTLIKPILAQARAARDAPAPWGQTQAEKQFGALLDNRIADDIAKASNFPIAQRIADQILKNSPIIDIQPNNIQPNNIPATYSPVDIFG